MWTDNSQEMFFSLVSYPITILFSLREGARLVHVHRTASRISEILILDQLALIKDELLCH